MKKLYTILVLLIIIQFNVFPQSIWQPANGQWSGNVQSLATNSDGNIFVGTSSGIILRTSDFGVNWVVIYRGLTNSIVYSLIVNSNGDIFAGIYGSGVYRSTDNGNNWTEMNNGLPNNSVVALAVNSSGIIFAGISSISNNGVYRSTDNGNNWTEMNNGLPNSSVSTLAINSSGDIFLSMNGVYRSTDNGNNWTELTSLTNRYVASFAINSSGDIFAGTSNNGVYRSTDNGNNWTEMNNGLMNLDVTSLYINTSGDIFVGTLGGGVYGGVFRSTDNGKNWVSLTSLTTKKVYSLTINSSGEIYAGTNGEVFRSTDNGNNWMPINTSLSNKSVYSFAVNSSGIIFAGTDGGIFRSTDNGNNWREINNGLTSIDINSIAVNSNGDVFAGTNDAGIFKSTDNGDTWIHNGLTTYAVLSLRSNSNGDIFAGTGGGVFRSTDNGNNWTELTGLPNNIFNSLVVNPNGDIFTGTSNYGIFRSTDNGETWMNISTGLTNNNVTSFAINISSNIFAGTYGGGVFRSTDNGETWTSINLGLTYTYVSSLVINASGYIFAGTYNINGGVFRSTDNGETWMNISTGLTNRDIRSFIVNNSGYIYAGTYKTGIFSTIQSTTKLAKPSLTSPANNSTSVSLSPTLSWSTVSGADKYKLEVNSKADFTGTVIYDQDTVSLSQKQIGGLFDNTTYYWRVTALNNAGNSSDTSNTFNFTTGKSVLVASTNGAIGVSTSPTLSWNKTTGANKYRLEVNTKNDFTGTAVFDNSAVTDTTQALSGLSNNTTYYWRVTASSNALAKTSTSDVYSFTTKLEKPSLTAPINNSTGISLIPTLSWSAVSGADRYRLEVNTASDFTGTVIYDQDTVHNALKKIGNLFDNTIYYWRVTGLGNNGNFSDVSEFFNFKTGQTILSSATNGMVGISTSPTLSWNKTDGADKYRLEVNTKQDFTGSVAFDNSALADTSEIINGLSFNTTYYWRVTANSNALTKATTSDVYSFTTKLEKPSLISPSNYSANVSITPILNWSTISGADKYRVEVNYKSDFNGGVIYNQDTVTNNSVALSGLENDTTYYWRVTALNSLGNYSDTSNTYNFSTLKLTGIEALNGIIPESYNLYQNYPNPFNPSTIIRYALPSESKVTIKIYNLLGQELKTLVNSNLSAGYHEVTFNANNLASGIYFYRIAATSADEKNDFADTKKLILMK